MVSALLDLCLLAPEAAAGTLCRWGVDPGLTLLLATTAWGIWVCCLGWTLFFAVRILRWLVRWGMCRFRTCCKRG